MTIKQELIYYAKGCINGKIISCTKHKQACQRFLDDLERAKSKDCPFIWNESEAQKIVKWFSYLKHSKGVLAGQPIIYTAGGNVARNTDGSTKPICRKPVKMPNHRSKPELFCMKWLTVLQKIMKSMNVFVPEQKETNPK